MTVLMLDAAFPPNPNQWVADMQSVGAKAGAVYVWGGFINYTPSHVTAAVNAGISILPIVVPGNVGPDPAQVLQVIKTYGINGGPIAIDIESGSLPTGTWDANFDTYMKNNGFHPIEYGTKSRFGPWGGPYTDDDDLWIASWIRTGTLNPIPSLPAGDKALQFVNDININGHQYDASVVDESIFSTSIIGDSDLTPQEHDMLVHMNDTVSHIFNFEFFDGDSEVGTPKAFSDIKDAVGAADKRIDDLAKQVAVLSAPTQVNADAIVTSLFSRFGDKLKAFGDALKS